MSTTKKNTIKLMYVSTRYESGPDNLILNIDVPLTTAQENYIRENAWMPRELLAIEIGISRLQLCHKIDLWGIGVKELKIYRGKVGMAQ